MFGLKKTGYRYASTFVHPSSASHATPADASFNLHIESQNGHDVRDFRFASPECMEGFLAGMKAAKDMGADINIGPVGVVTESSDEGSYDLAGQVAQAV